MHPACNSRCTTACCRRRKLATFNSCTNPTATSTGEISAPRASRWMTCNAWAVHRLLTLEQSRFSMAPLRPTHWAARHTEPVRNRGARVCSRVTARFETKEFRAASGELVRLVLVPDFGIEQSCVLVSLDTLECRVVSFSGLLNDGPKEMAVDA